MTQQVGADPGEQLGACPDPEDLALLAQWDVMQSGMRRLSDQLLSDVEAEAGLAPSSFQVLWFLLTAAGNSAPMNQLTATLGFTTAGTTKVADRLAAAGLLERRQLPADRRITLATLTDAGRKAAVTAALTLAGALRERVVRSLGAEGFADLSSTLRSLDPAPDQHCG
ncbi:MarR family winged helix-turn-helix transcriptional regulator [Streptomyces polygonati]|uniref:MarR family winged helix-turn-helix transcriptional regulator n=1 Tax=Streptomyces polygonati TaxID=1617087 RepID=A0ABV8HW00_9ACTN